jgi:hypothetical protein
MTDPGPDRTADRRGRDVRKILVDSRTAINTESVQLLADASSNVSTADEAADAVARALADPGARSRTRRQVASDLFHRPGTATARAVSALYERMAFPPPAPATVPDREACGHAV